MSGRTNLTKGEGTELVCSVKTERGINAHINVTRYSKGRNITVCSFKQRLGRCQVTRTSNKRYNCTCGGGTKNVISSVTIRSVDVVDSASWFCAASEEATSDSLTIRVNCK